MELTCESLKSEVTPYDGKGSNFFTQETDTAGNVALRHLNPDTNMVTTWTVCGKPAETVLLYRDSADKRKNLNAASFCAECAVGEQEFADRSTMLAGGSYQMLPIIRGDWRDHVAAPDSSVPADAEKRDEDINQAKFAAWAEGWNAYAGYDPSDASVPLPTNPYL